MEFSEALKKMEKKEKKGFLVSAVAIVSGKEDLSRWTLIYQNAETKAILDIHVGEEGVEYGKESSSEEEFKELPVSKIKISSKTAIDKARKEINKIPMSIVVSLINNQSLVWKVSIISQDLTASTVEIDAASGKIIKKSETSIGRRA
jgi:uncharacterized membrane protein YkoI